MVVSLLNGPGERLPESLRQRFERAAGESLSEVRVFAHAAVASFGALALCHGHKLYFAPGAYRPETEAGAHLLAHEIAHVLQQRAGRVAVAHDRLLVVDAALEAEADALADQLLNGAPIARTWARSRRRDDGPWPVQPYRVLTSAQLNRENARWYGNAQFLGQDRWAPHSPDNESFLNDQGQVNIVQRQPNQVALRVSNDGGMAVEDTDIDSRQARVCFATDERIRENNTALNKAGSSYRLGKMMDTSTPPAPRSIIITGRTLFQVQMVKDADGTPYASNSTNCDDTVGEIMGVKQNFQRTPKSDPRIPGVLPRSMARLREHFFGSQLSALKLPAWTMDDQAALRVAMFVARFIEEQATADDRNAADNALAEAVAIKSDLEIVGDARDREEQTRLLKEYTENVLRLDQRYGTPVPANLAFRYNLICRTFAVNEWANPVPGEAFYTASIAGMQKTGDHWSGKAFDMTPPQYITCWPFHWGAVVAKQGDDRIIFENYARNQEDGNSGASPRDTRAFFEMYQVPPHDQQAAPELAKSWHATWKTKGFANGLTLAVKAVR
jgi:hypothetical protein